MHKTLRNDFMTSVIDALGRPAQADDFLAEDMTPDHNHIDPLDLDPDFPDLVLQVSHKTADNYVGAEIQFSRGGIVKRGLVTSQKQDHNGDPIGLANDNHLLDTREYVICFDDGDEAELSANLIAESM